MSLNEQLLALCKSEALSAEGIEALLKQGAQANFAKHEDGTWGAREVTSCLNEVIRTSQKLFEKILYSRDENAGKEVFGTSLMSQSGKVCIADDDDDEAVCDDAKKTAKLKRMGEIASQCARMCKLLLDNGAKPTELWESYDWRGCGRSQVSD